MGVFPTDAAERCAAVAVQATMRVRRTNACVSHEPAPRRAPTVAKSLTDAAERCAAVVALADSAVLRVNACSLRTTEPREYNLHTS